jgi:hypothetical protein
MMSAPSTPRGALQIGGPTCQARSMTARPAVQESGQTERPTSEVENGRWRSSLGLDLPFPVQDSR